MKYLNSKYIIPGVVLLIFFIVFITYYSFIGSLPIYRQPGNQLVAPNGTIYEFNGKLTSDFGGGLLKTDHLIGKLNDGGLFPTKIYSLKGYGKNKTIFMNRLMDQEVFTIKNRN